MTITLYKNTNERNSLRPALSQIGNILVGNFRESSSLINIQIRIEKPPLTIYKANYMFIDELNRYYHINNITAERANIAIINATLDPLYTYYKEIINCPGIIARTESQSANNYLNDNEFSYSVIPAIIREKFSNSPTDTTTILIVSAGATETPATE